MGVVQCQQMVPFQPAQPNTPTHSNSEDDNHSPTTAESKQLGRQDSKGAEPEEEIVEVNNLTLINVLLRVRGPMTEAETTACLLKFQVPTLGCCVVFVASSCHYRSNQHCFHSGVVGCHMVLA